jgi:hypothetical protein
LPSRRPLAFVLVLIAAPAAVRGEVRIGPEFRVNTHTTNAQMYPAVGADAAGNFIVVWESFGQDGSGLGVFGRFYDAAGTPLSGTEFRVNAYTSTHQTKAAVASTPDGRVMVVWHSLLQDGSGSGIYARTYASSTAPPGPEIQVNTYTLGSQAWPAVAADAGGHFVVAWSSPQDGHNYGVFARRFDALGQPVAGEFLVNTYTTGSQTAVSIASDAAGNFVVAWQSQGQDGDGYGIFAQRYDATGVRVGGEFQVNALTAGDQGEPEMAADAEGNFVVTWTLSAGANADVRARRYDATGTSPGGEFEVNAYTTQVQAASGVAMDSEGRFVVTWLSDFQDGSGSGVFGRRYDALGVPEGPEFLLNVYVTGNQFTPRVAADGRGNFVSAWSSDHDGSGQGIFGQQWKPDLIFRDGFENGTLGAWSSSTTDGGDLAVSVIAGMKSTTAGLRGVVDDTAGIFVQDDSPDGEGVYRARFYFDPVAFDPGEAQMRFRTRIFLAFSDAPTRRVAAIVLRRQGGVYSIRGRARRDDNSQADTPFVPISAGPHAIELLLARASAPGLSDGFFQLFIDGSSGVNIPLPNSLTDVDFVRMGALSVKPGASGTMHWDEFESRRQEYIAP